MEKEMRHPTANGRDSGVDLADQDLPDSSSQIKQLAPRPFKFWLIAIATGAGLFGLVVVWAACSMGSLGAGLAYLHGEYIYANLKGPLVEGQEDRDIVLLNLTNQPIRITGVNAGCSCVEVAGVPMQLGPRESKAFHVRALGPTNQEQIVPVVFMTDALQQPWIRLDLTVLKEAR